ncbi:MAG: lycopene cyclase, partial [Chitinophagia bacterium]|nr:lycopene cyclase [Chitinophagia bacterium]
MIIITHFFSKKTKISFKYIWHPVPTGAHIKSKSYHLLQHFKGWMIETSEDCFDPDKATFMDFRVSQQSGTTFVYVLPVTNRRALVEY